MLEIVRKGIENKAATVINVPGVALFGILCAVPVFVLQKRILQAWGKYRRDDWGIGIPVIWEKAEASVTFQFRNRWLREGGDMIEVNKIMHWRTRMANENCFSLSRNPSSFNEVDRQKEILTQWVIKMWNPLPKNAAIITVVNSFTKSVNRSRNDRSNSGYQLSASSASWGC